MDKNNVKVWSANEVEMSCMNVLVIWSNIVTSILENEGLTNEIKVFETDLKNYLKVKNNG